MILAGIDEAGYGPILGPLTVGCCAVRLPEGVDAHEAMPDAWALLRRAVSRKRHKAGRTLHVDDSKKVYSPAVGLRELERSVLAFVAAAGHAVPCDIDALLAAVAPGAREECAAIDWYARPAEEQLPCVADASDVNIMANALRQELLRAGMAVAAVRAEVLFEPRLNRLFEATRNKSSVLFTAAATHLDRLLRQHAAEGLVVILDRHGGRAHYAPLLRMMFEEWALEVHEETDGRSTYELRRGSAWARLTFVEKGDGLCLPTAVAAMTAKYLREVLMGRLNAFWTTRLPELKPTAGYWTDGKRFLQDIAPLRAELGIPDAACVRAR